MVPNDILYAQKRKLKIGSPPLSCLMDAQPRLEQKKKKNLSVGPWRQEWRDYRYNSPLLQLGRDGDGEGLYQCVLDQHQFIRSLLKETTQS